MIEHDAEHLQVLFDAFILVTMPAADNAALLVPAFGKIEAWGVSAWPSALAA